MRTRFLLVIAVVIAALSVTPATAATMPQRVTVSASPDGLVAPGVATLRPGTTTFTVSTPDTQRRYVGVVGLKPGASFDTYLDNMAIVLFGPDAEKPRAGAAVQRDVAVGGGVVVYSRAAQSTTVVLAPGTYYLVDYTSLRAERHWHRITVSGEWTHTNPGTDHMVLQYERDGQRVVSGCGPGCRWAAADDPLAASR